MSESLITPELPRLGRLRGRTAIVTGGGSAGEMPGSGAAMAVLFASEGANVAILDIDEVRARHTHEAIQKSGDSSIVVIADVTDIGQCATGASQAIEAFGRVDVLVNNAGIAPDERANADDLYQKVIDLNLRAAKIMSDACIPHMQEIGAGSIVMISSGCSTLGGGGIAYSASKAGLVGMARAMAFKYGRTGIRVNVVSPGHVALPMGLGYEGWEDGVNQRVLRAQASMLGTEGDGWDVAYAALYLASAESRYVTAASITVDGGAHSAMPLVMHPYLSEAV
jgi:NAD(P)-dependent dehydrogenase (short-subunit alcohol dehydrogenase family)